MMNHSLVHATIVMQIYTYMMNDLDTASSA